MPDNKADQKEPKSTHTITVSHTHVWWGVGALILLGIVFVVGVGLGNWHGRGGMFYRTGGFKSGFAGPMMMQRHYGGQLYGGQNSANSLGGVVTAVNGNNFTVAGFGSTTNVATNSSTQYQGGNAVKVNDTVRVFGTTNNGTLTATEVVINP